MADDERKRGIGRIASSFAGDVASGIMPIAEGMTSEEIEALKAQIEADLTESLTATLMQTLSDQIAENELDYDEVPITTLNPSGYMDEDERKLIFVPAIDERDTPAVAGYLDLQKLLESYGLKEANDILSQIKERYSNIDVQIGEVEKAVQAAAEKAMTQLSDSYNGYSETMRQLADTSQRLHDEVSGWKDDAERAASAAEVSKTQAAASAEEAGSARDSATASEEAAKSALGEVTAARDEALSGIEEQRTLAEEAIGTGLERMESIQQSVESSVQSFSDTAASAIEEAQGLLSQIDETAEQIAQDQAALDKAVGDAQAAAESAGTAKTGADDAAARAEAAAEEAASSKTAAASSAEGAASSKTAAETAAGEAKTSAETAGTAKTDAASSKTAAETAQKAAEKAKEEAEALIAAFQAKDTYTKSEEDAKLALKADKSNTYTKSETDTKLGTKANSSDVYKKMETYTRSEMDSRYVQDNAISTTGTVNNTTTWSRCKVIGEILIQWGHFYYTNKGGDNGGRAVVNFLRAFGSMPSVSITMSDNYTSSANSDLLNRATESSPMDVTTTSFTRRGWDAPYEWIAIGSV